MRLSIEWLTDYLNINLNPTEIVTKIKQHTTNVETIHHMGQGISGIAVGRIEKIEAHPNADKLVICKVNIGKEENIQIVTADLTVKEGDVVPVALDGAVLKEGFKIKSRPMRGADSNGMFCSLEEVEVEEKSDTVYRIMDKAELGADFVKHFKLTDELVEIEVFPNRPDLLSYIGAAKELEIIEAGDSFRLPEYTKLETGNGFPVSIEYEGCKRYSAVVLRNVKVGRSPLWLVRRLATAGIRSINNIVDITNYVMLETGHPVHAFDLNLIGNKIVVKKAEQGSKVLLLDGKTYELNGTETLITDGEKILALGGVMGGELSGINENTTDVLLEVAYFDPVITRKTSKFHKLSTDSSFRFERGIDPNDTELVMGRLVKFMSELCGATIDGPMTDAYPAVLTAPKIHVRQKYANSRIGKELSRETIEKIYDKFGFTYTSTEDGWDVTVITKRPDLQEEIDMVEEIGRVYGYHNIESQMPGTMLMHGSKSEFVMFKDLISETMRGSGYHEALTFSFMNEKNMWLERPSIRLLNPLSAEYEWLRPLVVYGILEAASYNFRNQNRDVKLFEISKTFVKDDSYDTGAKETTKLAVIALGKENPFDYTDKRDVSFYTVKGALETFFDVMNLTAVYEKAEITGMMRTQTAKIKVNNEELGFIGLLSSEIADKLYDIKVPVYIAEIDLDKVFALKQPLSKENKTYDFPAIKREYCFMVPAEVQFGQIETIINNSGKIIEGIRIFDVYKGKGIEGNVTSITTTIVFRAPDRTLTDEDVNKVEEKMLKKLGELNVKLRGQ